MHYMDRSFTRGRVILSQPMCGFIGHSLNRPSMWHGCLVALMILSTSHVMAQDNSPQNTASDKGIAIATSSATSAARVSLKEQLAHGGSVTLIPGHYDEAMVIDQSDIAVFAYGVTVTKPVLIEGQHVRLEGLAIRDASVGLQIVRGQGSSIRDVTCTNCEVGFLFGCTDVYKNSQVTYSTFESCTARDCTVGWQFDSSAKVARSWCNANTFLNCSARQCKTGWSTTGVEPNFSYNTFIGGSSEGCDRVLDMPHANDVLFVGCHIVGREATETIELGRNCKIMGGRWTVHIPPTVAFWAGGQSHINMPEQLQAALNQRQPSPRTDRP